MKYVLATLAAIAALAAAVFHPPDRGITPITIGTAAAGSQATVDALERAARTPLPVKMATPPARSVTVYVAGEVQRPGVYALATGKRAVDALARAGGPLADADLIAVNLAAPLDDGGEIAVPKIGAEPNRRRNPRPRASHRPRRHRTRPQQSSQEPAAAPHPLDLNAATQTDLEAVPGIGAGLAARIIAYRETNGPFASVDELADVAGITPRLQDSLAQYVFVQ